MCSSDLPVGRPSATLGRHCRNPPTVLHFLRRRSFVAPRPPGRSRRRREPFSVSDEVPSASTTDLKAPADGEGRHVIGEGYLVRIYPPNADRGLIRLPQERFFMGRGSDCQLAVDDTAVSRVHAYIDYKIGRAHV